MTLTETLHADSAILTLSGEADLAGVPLLQQALRSRRAAGSRLVIVDFSAVTFVNTPVWALIIEHYQWCGTHAARVAISGLAGRALASFDTVQLGTFIPHFPSTEEAIRAMRVRD